MRRVLIAIRAGLESLTVTGPSPVLEEAYREALEAVAHRPTRQERETLLSRAWHASSVDEMYAQARAALSGSGSASGQQRPEKLADGCAKRRSKSCDLGNAE